MIYFTFIPLSICLFWCGWAAHAFGARGPRDSLKKGLTVEANGETDESDLEWCHPDKIDTSGALISGLEMIAPDWNAETLKEVLSTRGLNIIYGWTQQQLEHFAKELSTGKARLAKKGSLLLRVIDMVIVLVVYEQDELVLQELSDQAFKGVANKEADIKECTLKSRLRASEGLMTCAERCLQKLGTGMDRFIEIVPDVLEMREEKRILHSAHPGLPTLMQYYVVKARVVARSRHDLELLGLLSRTLHVSGYIYKWDHLDNVPYAKKHLKQSWVREGAVRWMGVSHSFEPVLPWTENAVIEKLEERGFRDRDALSPHAMQDLLQALKEGRLSLAVLNRKDPKVALVEERVSVVVTSPRNAQVLLSGFSEDGVPILPSVQRHASESCWRAAVRLSQQTLRLSAPLFRMDGEVLGASDKIVTQKSWELIKREVILRGPLID